MRLRGVSGARVFRRGVAAMEFAPGADLSELLGQIRDAHSKAVTNQ
ncbi:hypothetical protein [Nannocystis sp. SCPEA4]|nr:hypothetical protein [Nannocystis sp. SCPEA4]MCY1060735.1 hypothetical protein [Nannocystis sp. SCPEA4]